MLEIKMEGYITGNKVVFKRPIGFLDSTIYLRNKEVKVLVDTVENGANLQALFLEGLINSMEYMRISKALLEGGFFVYQEEPKRYYIKLYDDFEGYLNAYGFGFDKVLDHGTKEEEFGKQTMFTRAEIAKLRQCKGLPIPAITLKERMVPVE